MSSRVVAELMDERDMLLKALEDTLEYALEGICHEVPVSGCVLCEARAAITKAKVGK